MDEMTDFRAEEKEAEQAQKEQIAEEQAQVMIDANCGRSADYEEIIRVARAFEAYLKGEINV